MSTSTNVTKQPSKKRLPTSIKVALWIAGTVTLICAAGVGGFALGVNNFIQGLITMDDPSVTLETSQVCKSDGSSSYTLQVLNPTDAEHRYTIEVQHDWPNVGKEREDLGKFNGEQSIAAGGRHAVVVIVPAGKTYRADLDDLTTGAQRLTNLPACPK